MSLARRLAVLERLPLPTSQVVADQVRQAFGGHAGAMCVVAARIKRAFTCAIAAGARNLDALARAVPIADPDLAASLAGVPAEVRKAIIQQAEERFGAPAGVLASRLIGNLAPTT